MEKNNRMQSRNNQTNNMIRIRDKKIKKRNSMTRIVGK